MDDMTEIDQTRLTIACNDLTWFIESYYSIRFLALRAHFVYK